MALDTIKTTPRSYAQAMQTPEADPWDKANESELKNLEEIGNITEVDRQPGLKLIPFMEVFFQKYDPIMNQRK